MLSPVSPGPKIEDQSSAWYFLRNIRLRGNRLRTTIALSTSLHRGGSRAQLCHWPNILIHDSPKGVCAEVGCEVLRPAFATLPDCPANPRCCVPLSYAVLKHCHLRTYSLHLIHSFELIHLIHPSSGQPQIPALCPPLH